MIPQNPIAAPTVGAEIDVAPDDGQLLKRFIEIHDEAAFRTLVEVHGSMVFGVCRRVIGNCHDADDAFQATFLVLARKARSMCSRRSIAGWLYEVAYRTALKARNVEMRKKNREAPLPDDLEAETSDSSNWSALRPLLDEELNRLPENYRAPLILCYLEGKSYTQAAAQLGCPEGTLSVRLMRAKAKLAELLRRRGLVLTVATLGSLLAAGSSMAAVPPANLTALTIQGAAVYATGQAPLAGLVSSNVVSLTDLTLKSMRLARWASVAGTVLISTSLVAVTLAGWHVAQGQVDEKDSTRSISVEPNESTQTTSDRDRTESTTNEEVPRTQQAIPPVDRIESGAKDVIRDPSTNNAVDSDLANAKWGTIRGRVVVDRPFPALLPLVRKADPAVKDGSVCAANDIPDESFLVDPQSRGLANVVIWLTKTPATIHPELAASKDKEVVFDQIGCQFVPHVLSVRTDQVVRVKSSDPIAHNTHTYPLKNISYNFVVQPGTATGILMSPMPLAERLPVKVGCDIHPWMQAWWVILDHPYVAVTNEKGEFEIANLPVGKHEFRVWQERIGYIEKSYKVDVSGGQISLDPLVVSTSSLR